MHLDTRRNRDLIESYKIKNNIYNVNADIFFEFDQGGKRGHSRKLFKRRSKLNVRKYVFSNRIVDKWNSLSCLAE